MTEVWNSGAAGGPCHPSYQLLAAGGMTHECVRKPQCVVCVMLTARGMDPTSLVGAPQTCSSSSKESCKTSLGIMVARRWGATERLSPFWTRGHMGVSPPSPSREHTALQDLPLDGRRMRGSGLWFCHCWSGQSWTALGKGQARGFCLEQCTGGEA